MLTELGGLAEFERDWIRTRTSERRERAKARGVKLGLKRKPTIVPRLATPLRQVPSERTMSSE